MALVLLSTPGEFLQPSCDDLVDAATDATGLQNGVWIYSDEQVRLAEELQTYVKQQGVTGQIFVATSSNPTTEAHILELFQKDHTKEYYEFGQ